MDSIWGAEIKKSKKSNYEGPNEISYLPDVIVGGILSFHQLKKQFVLVFYSRGGYTSGHSSPS